MKTLIAAVLASTAALAQAPTCTFTDFGRPCGGDLAGQVVRTTNGAGVRLDVTGATPLSFAVLAAGQQARPIALPGSNCLLLVDPRITVLQQVDRTGATAFRFHLPPIAPLNVDFQAVTIALSRSGRMAESTDGVTLNCR